MSEKLSFTIKIKENSCFFRKYREINIKKRNTQWIGNTHRSLGMQVPIHTLMEKNPDQKILFFHGEQNFESFEKKNQYFHKKIQNFDQKF